MEDEKMTEEDRKRKEAEGIGCAMLLILLFFAFIGLRSCCGCG